MPVVHAVWGAAGRCEDQPGCQVSCDAETLASCSAVHAMFRSMPCAEAEGNL